MFAAGKNAAIVAACKRSRDVLHLPE